jgi:hypothetical protein
MMLIPSKWYSVSRSSLGRGLVAERELPAGQVLGDYLGRLVRPRVEREGLYLLFLRRDLAVAPDVPAVGPHLANHSCEPNCLFFPFRGHVLFVTRRRVFPGEALTLDYGVSPPPPRSPIGLYLCRCGAELCRGTFLLSPAGDARVDRLFYSSAWAGAPRPRQPLGSTLEPLARYPTQVRGPSGFEVFASSAKRPLNLPLRRVPTRSDAAARIRETGRALQLPALGLQIRATLERSLVILPARSRASAR